ncbi:hypothetical protein H4218_004972 [Coemansia sp. IMI 209128]|nr:hypothetical protein GGI06_000780 [Coemansia sp. S85]KAJ2695886.1 hypothetical protein H4218_004972 [Coemansia sp. IMI 209128]
MVVDSVSYRSCQIFVEFKALLMPLLWVCHNFRAVVYSQYSVSFWVIFNRLPDKLKAVWDGSPDFYVYSDYPKHHFARELRVHLDEHSVYSGKFLETLQDQSFDAGAFPMARSITLYFSMLADAKESSTDLQPVSDIPGAEANIDAFVQHIKSMAPKLKEIKVKGSFESESVPAASRYLTQRLVTRLFSLARCVEFKGLSWVNPYSFLLGDTCNMVHLNLRVYSSVGPAALLARRCALTLETLSIGEWILDGISGPTQSEDGTFAIYPWLRTLRLISKYDLREPVQLFKGAVPFPNLDHLHIGERYPFGDDVVFRGNATKLRVLQIRLNPPLINILRAYRPLTPTSHPNLQHVKITRSIGLIRDSFETDFDSYTRFVLQFGHGAMAREFGQFSSDLDHVRNAINKFSDHAYIQVLKLHDTYMGLWDVFGLIKSLPLLTDLHTMDAHVHPLPSGLTTSDLPAHVIANYSSTPNRFQCWHASLNIGLDVEAYAMCLLLLALVCPAFNYMAHRDLAPKRLLEKLVALGDADEFKPHTPRLERLFDKWRNVKQIEAHGTLPLRRR